MPKYQNKQRLKRIIASGKEMNSLTEFLILHGKSYEEAIKGIEPYVVAWEKSVENLEEMTTLDTCSEEYEFEVWSRTILDEVLKQASEYETSLYKNRIDEADIRFKNITLVSSCSDQQKNSEKENQWWRFRWLKN